MATNKKKGKKKDFKKKKLKILYTYRKVLKGCIILLPCPIISTVLTGLGVTEL